MRPLGSVSHRYNYKSARHFFEVCRRKFVGTQFANCALISPFHVVLLLLVPDGTIAPADCDNERQTLAALFPAEQDKCEISHMVVIQP